VVGVLQDGRTSSVCGPEKMAVVCRECDISVTCGAGRGRIGTSRLVIGRADRPLSTDWPHVGQMVAQSLPSLRVKLTRASRCPITYCLLSFT
jgi:hypothetical protein